jgi:phosphoglycolate phosphatase
MASLLHTQLPKALVFDLDGTLVDTAPDLTNVLNWLLAREGRAIIDEASVRHMVGRGARSLITKGMSATGALPNDSEMSRLFNDFIDYYGAHIADYSLPFPGVIDTLEAFRDAGILMGVCTNKPEGLSRQLLEALDMNQYFTALLGGDSLAVKKPDPAHLLKTIEALGAEPHHSVMVGDSISDIQAAKNARIPVVGVTFGYTDIPIEDLNPDIIIHQFADLPRALGQMLADI